MRILGASVLVFEAIVVLLAIPAAIATTDRPASALVAGGFGLALLLVATAGLLRRDWAFGLGWALQAAVVACGFVVPAMFVLGVVFLLLWWLALHLGRRGDEARRQREATGD